MPQLANTCHNSKPQTPSTNTCHPLRNPPPLTTTHHHPPPLATTCQHCCNARKPAEARPSIGRDPTQGGCRCPSGCNRPIDDEYDWTGPYCNACDSDGEDCECDEYDDHVVPCCQPAAQPNASPTESTTTRTTRHHSPQLVTTCHPRPNANHPPLTTTTYSHCRLNTTYDSPPTTYHQLPATQCSTTTIHHMSTVTYHIPPTEHYQPDSAHCPTPTTHYPTPAANDATASDSTIANTEPTIAPAGQHPRASPGRKAQAEERRRLRQDLRGMAQRPAWMLGAMRTHMQHDAVCSDAGQVQAHGHAADPGKDGAQQLRRRRRSRKQQQHDLVDCERRRRGAEVTCTAHQSSPLLITTPYHPQPLTTRHDYIPPLDTTHHQSQRLINTQLHTHNNPPLDHNNPRPKTNTHQRPPPITTTRHLPLTTYHQQPNNLTHHTPHTIHNPSTTCLIPTTTHYQPPEATCYPSRAPHDPILDTHPNQPTPAQHPSDACLTPATYQIHTNITNNPQPPYTHSTSTPQYSRHPHCLALTPHLAHIQPTPTARPPHVHPTPTQRPPHTHNTPSLATTRHDSPPLDTHHHYSQPLATNRYRSHYPLPLPPLPVTCNDPLLLATECHHPPTAGVRPHRRRDADGVMADGHESTTELDWPMKMRLVATGLRATRRYDDSGAGESACSDIERCECGVGCVPSVDARKGAVREGIRWFDRGLVGAALTRMVAPAVTPNDNNPTRCRTKQHNNSVMMYAWDTQECYNVSCAKNIIFKSAHSEGHASDSEHCPRITCTTPRPHGRLHINAYHVGPPARGSTPRDISGESNTTTPNTPSENPTEAKPQTNPTGMTEGTGRSVTINGHKHKNPEVNGDTTVINMAPDYTKVEDQTEHTGIITGTDQTATKNKYKYNASGADDDAMDTHLTLHKTVTGNTQDTARQVNGPLIKLTNHNNTISANVETQPRMRTARNVVWSIKHRIGTRQPKTYAATMRTHHCTNAPLRNGTTAPPRQCNNAPRRHCTTAPLHHRTTAPLHHGNTAPLHHCTTTPQHNCTDASPCHCTTAPLHYSASALPHHRTTVPLHYCTVALLRHHATAPLHHGTTSPLHYLTTAPSPRHCTTTPLHHCTAAPLRHRIAPLHHCTTARQHHRATAHPHTTAPLHRYTTGTPHHRKTTPLHNCTTAPPHHYSTTTLHYYNTAPPHHCAAASPHHHTTAALHHNSTTAPPHQCTTAPLHHNTTAPPYHRTTTPLHPCTVATRHRSTTAPLRHCTTAPLATLHHCATAPLHHCTTVQPHHRTTAPLHHRTTATQYYCITTHTTTPDDDTHRQPSQDYRRNETIGTATSHPKTRGRRRHGTLSMAHHHRTHNSTTHTSDGTHGGTDCTGSRCGRTTTQQDATRRQPHAKGTETTA